MVKKKIFLFVFISLIFVSFIGFVSAADFWDKNLSSGEGYSVKQTSDGGYIIAGSDLLLIKTNSSGGITWNKTYGEVRSDGGDIVQQTSDGGYIACGVKTVSGYTKIYLLKTDSNGNKVWEKTYGNGFCYSVQQNVLDGGYILTGYDPYVGNFNAFLLKTNSLGVQQWYKTYGGSSTYEQGRSVQQTTDGGYILTGFTGVFGAGSGYKVYLVKTNSNGVAQWTKEFGGPISNYWYKGLSVLQVPSQMGGGYIITGSGLDITQSNRTLLLKTDSNGIEQWRKYLSGKGSGNSIDITYDLNSSLSGYIYGYIIISGGGDDAINLIKTNSSGDIQWSREYSKLNYNYYDGNSVQQTSDGGYILTGYLGTYLPGDIWSTYIYLIKTDSEGTFGCTDSDGENYNVKGTVRYLWGSEWKNITDYCGVSGSRLYLYEPYCYSPSYGLTIYTCPTGQVCSDGACILQPPATCPANQTIMKISSSTNALGGLWDSILYYPVSICYPNIFGKDYVGLNPHTCNSTTNKVVGLNDSTNALAQVPIQTTYTKPVCYGDLQCINTTSSPCPAGYNETLRLSSLTNAHIENSSGTGNYPIRICCKSAASTGAVCPNNICEAGENYTTCPADCAALPYWAEAMRDVKITLADVNDTVSLVWNINLANGTAVNFTIHERDTGLFDSDCFGDGIKLQSAVSGGKAIATWKAKLCNNGKSDGVYFDAFVASNPSTKDTSNYLAITTTEDNEYPVAIISKPQEGKWYPVNSPLSFGQASYDVDDKLVEYKWTLGDGNITTLLGTSSGNLTHTYLTGGPMNIDLTVKSGVGGRAKISSDEITIGINTTGNDAPLAIISSPIDGQRFKGGAVAVVFNATLSSDDKTAFENLTFSWMFDGNPNNPLNHNGKGNAGAYFSKQFPVGDHSLRLIVDDADTSP